MGTFGWSQEIDAVDVFEIEVGIGSIHLVWEMIRLVVV